MLKFIYSRTSLLREKFLVRQHKSLQILPLYNAKNFRSLQSRYREVRLYHKFSTKLFIKGCIIFNGPDVFALVKFVLFPCSKWRFKVGENAAKAFNFNICM
jgi:hypothetical protein